MGIKEKIVRFLAADVIEREVTAGVRRAKMSLPIMADYDPHGEGYRRLSGGSPQRRDLSTLNQERMFEIGYFMFDSSPMFKGLAELDKKFLFSEPVTVQCTDEKAQEVVDAFRDDPVNNLDIDFPNLMMWLSILGEQVWPVEVNPANGHVTLGYADPSTVKDIIVSAHNVKEIVQVELYGRTGGTGRKLNAIRRDANGGSKTFGRLNGECFFFALNHPPNSPRGRSDYLTLFDWIDSLERYGYNYLERAELLLNFIWDIQLKGMTEEEIRDWLRNQAPPNPGALRAHNENVEWGAVAPDLKAHDYRSGFDMGKGFILGALRRPESWFGGGGKAYQTEAEQFGQVPVKDLEERQLLIKFIYGQVIRFVLDQAAVHGRLTEQQADAGFTVNMPEISRSDTTAMTNAMPQITTSLSLAEQNTWISTKTARRLYSFLVGMLGYDIDPEEEEREIGKQRPEDQKDYEKMLEG